MFTQILGGALADLLGGKWILQWRPQDFRIIYGKQLCEKRNNTPLILEVSACIVFGTKM